MPDADDLTGWERLAALIEECRAEREACATIRVQAERGDMLARSIYAAVTDRLMAGVLDIHPATPGDDLSR